MMVLIFGVLAVSVIFGVMYKALEAGQD